MSRFQPSTVYPDLRQCWKTMGSFLPLYDSFYLVHCTTPHPSKMVWKLPPPDLQAYTVCLVWKHHLNFSKHVSCHCSHSPVFVIMTILFCSVCVQMPFRFIMWTAEILVKLKKCQLWSTFSCLDHHLFSPCVPLVCISRLEPHLKVWAMVVPGLFLIIQTNVICSNSKGLG